MTVGKCFSSLSNNINFTELNESVVKHYLLENVSSELLALTLALTNYLNVDNLNSGFKNFIESLVLSNCDSNNDNAVEVGQRKNIIILSKYIDKLFVIFERGILKNNKNNFNLSTLMKQIEVVYSVKFLKLCPAAADNDSLAINSKLNFKKFLKISKKTFRNHRNKHKQKILRGQHKLFYRL